MLYLELSNGSGSLGLFISTRKVINFCNLVDLRRLPKCVQGWLLGLSLVYSLDYLASLGFAHKLSMTYVLPSSCSWVPLSAFSVGEARIHHNPS